MPEEAYLRLAQELVEEVHADKRVDLIANLEMRSLVELGLSQEMHLGYLRAKLGAYTTEDGRPMSEGQKEHVLAIVRNELWGYGILDDLIRNQDVSDIKLYCAKNIRQKATGRRLPTGVAFESEQAYRSFVTRLLERNRVNLGTANAIQTFTDKSQEDFILRITVISELLSDTGLPVVAIRKTNRVKQNLRDLSAKGMFRRTLPTARMQHFRLQESYEDFMRLADALINSQGILVTGKGASGKSALMIALIEEIPSDESVKVCQENEELFNDHHPDFFSCHVLNNSGDSKVSYDLGELTRAALLMDIDRIIVGEVKSGSEAAGLSKASMTGHKCWTSVHGESCALGLEKMADYISQELGYSTADAMKQLQGFEFVVRMHDFVVMEVVHIEGWDADKRRLILRKVYECKQLPAEEVRDERID